MYETGRESSLEVQCINDMKTVVSIIWHDTYLPFGRRDCGDRDFRDWQKVTLGCLM